jgi:2-C-methyl-D-erythritol 4-phosphate cytidylyltransferase
MILGDGDNIKVTMPEDLMRGELILRRRSKKD